MFGRYRGTRLQRSIDRPLITMLDRKPLLRYGDMVFTRAWANFFLYGGVLTGPFPANTLATRNIGGRTVGQWEGARDSVFYPSDQANTNPAWSPANVTFTPNAVLAPDGNTTADEIIENNINAGIGIYAGSSGGAAAASWTFSIWLRNNNRRYIDVRLYGNAATEWGAITVDLQAGTVTQAQKGAGVTAAITSHIIASIVGGYFVALTVTFNGARDVYACLDFADSATPALDANLGYCICAGDGTHSVYAWGLQIERAATFRSSYIVTIGSGVTRPPDVGYWPAAVVPAAIASGRWSVDVIPEFSDTEASAWHMIASYSGTILDYFGIERTGGVTYVSVYDAATLAVRRAITFSREQKMTFTFDCVAGSVTVSGATIGNGTTVGVPWVHVISDVYWGSWTSGASLHFFGKLSEPY